VCPTDSSTIRRLPSLHGVPLGSVPPLPRYCEGATTSRCPFCLASFPSLGNTIYGLCPWSSLPIGIRTPLPIGQGFLSLVTLIQLRRHGASEISQVPGQPLFASALLSDLGGTSTSGHLMLRCYPRADNGEDSRSVGTNEAQSQGFCNHCLRFTAMVTHGHARLVSDCWPSFVGLDWLPTGSLRKVSAYTHSPFPSFAWRNTWIPLRNAFISAAGLFDKGCIIRKSLADLYQLVLRPRTKRRQPTEEVSHASVCSVVSVD